MTSYRDKSLRRRLRFEPLEGRRVLATLWVDPSVPPTPALFSSISAAVAAAHSGDTVKVVAGTYAEQVQVNTPNLTIIGGQVRVSGQSGASIVTSAGAFSTGFALTANGVTVKNFTIQNELVGAEIEAPFSGCSILHNTFTDNVFGISLNTSSASTAKTTTISTNKFTSTGAVTPQVSIGSAGGLSNVTISSNSIFAANATAGIQINGNSPSANVRIMNNQITSGQGVIIANATKAKIDGNSIGFLAAGANAIHLAGAVTGSEVANNTLVGSSGSAAALRGILLDESLVMMPDSGNKITGNTLTTREGPGGNQGFNSGIFLDHATQNTISGNSVSFAESEGIGLFSSDSNTVSSNTVTQTGIGSFNDGLGIFLENSNNNMVSKNVTSNNLGGGIAIGGTGSAATGNTVKQNTANFNYGPDASGIFLSSANQNKLVGNTANYNTRNGFELTFANNNVISGNTVDRNLEDGVRLDSSAGNMFSGNTADANISSGFDSDSMSTGNTFMKNAAKNNGIGLRIDSSGNMLVSNTVSGNGNGIFIGANTSNNLVKSNMVANNYFTGLFVSGSMATLSSNIIKNNQGDGIRLSQLTSSTISGNVVMNNDGDGINVFSNCSSNTISGNMAMGNGLALGGFDLFDASIGGGTAGTANTWLKNKAQTRSPAGLL